MLCQMFLHMEVHCPKKSRQYFQNPFPSYSYIKIDLTVLMVLGVIGLASYVYHGLSLP